MSFAKNSINYEAISKIIARSQTYLYQMSRFMRKPAFCICVNKDADQLRSKISTFVFATWIVQSLYFLNPKFQACSHILWLYSSVCVQPGRTPRRPVFSCRGSNHLRLLKRKPSGTLILDCLYQPVQFLARHLIFIA